MSDQRGRAEEKAAEDWRRDEHLAAEAERQTPFDGWQNVYENAALQQKFADGARWQAARDAETITVNAKVLDRAASGLADELQAQSNGVRPDPVEAWFLAEAAFRAAGFNIEEVWCDG